MAGTWRALELANFDTAGGAAGYLREEGYKMTYSRSPGRPSLVAGPHATTISDINEWSKTHPYVMIVIHASMKRLNRDLPCEMTFYSSEVELVCASAVLAPASVVASGLFGPDGHFRSQKFGGSVPRGSDYTFECKALISHVKSCIWTECPACDSGHFFGAPQFLMRGI